MSLRPRIRNEMCNPAIGGGALPMTSAAVPPWGELDEDYLADLAKRPNPQDWSPPDTLQAPTFERWRDGIINQIATMVWPIFDSTNSVWKAREVSTLFDADFALLDSLHSHLLLPIKGVFSTTVTHSDLFTEEDDRTIGFGFDYARYDPTLEPLAANQFRGLVRAGYINKVGTLDLQMKRVFQRPRPWQMALIQNRTAYRYRVAATADTPSLVSGHCLQGLMGVCNVFAEVGHSLTELSTEVLMQFAVDIGDRRVFAGVHYPSDNLSSWFTASQLIPCVFGASRAPAVKQFMWNAIENKSAVFAAIRDSIGSTSSSPYESIVEAIRESSCPREPGKGLVCGVKK